jgi:hypothetical protein
MRFFGCCLPASALLALVFSFHAPASAALLLRVDQVGSDVVVSGSGTANLAALTNDGTDNTWTNYLTDSEIYAGPDAFANGSVSLYSGIAGPSPFGNDSSFLQVPDAVGSSGDLFGILTANSSAISTNQLVLPLGYVSGASLSGTSTFANLSIAELGLTPGQVSTWSWGSGGDADSLRLEVAPAPAPFLGALVAFRMAKRLRRRQRTHTT